jgi:hypothetical protein
VSTNQRLRVLPKLYRVDFVEEGRLPADDAWIAVVRAPEGVTVVREVSSEPMSRPVSGSEAGAAEVGHAGGDERWVALYGGDTAHGLDLPGMLAALVGPLGQAGIPVFVASTFHADLVLVPSERLSDAAGVLRAAGHSVDSGDSVASGIESEL